MPWDYFEFRQVCSFGQYNAKVLAIEIPDLYCRSNRKQTNKTKHSKSCPVPSRPVPSVLKLYFWVQIFRRRQYMFLHYCSLSFWQCSSVPNTVRQLHCADCCVWNKRKTFYASIGWSVRHSFCNLLILQVDIMLIMLLFFLIPNQSEKTVCKEGQYSDSSLLYLENRNCD